MADHKPSVEVPLPKQAVILLSQHIGAPAQPVVAVGDKVKVGQLLAQAGGFVSAPVHSSVSGTVAKIDNVLDGQGVPAPAIFIEARFPSDHRDRNRFRYQQTTPLRSRMLP